MAGLAEADHMGQTLWIISVDTKLHKQLEVQRDPVHTFLWVLTGLLTC